MKTKLSLDVKPSIRLPEEAKAATRDDVEYQDALNKGILSELDRLHAIVRKHNLS